MRMNENELKQALQAAQNMVTEQEQLQFEEENVEMRKPPQAEWQEIYSKAKRKNVVIAGHRFSRVAMIIFLIIIVGSSSIVGISAAHRLFSNWIVNKTGKEDTFHFQKKEMPKHKVPKQIDTIYEPKYLPAGMKLIDQERDKLDNIFCYQGKAGYIECSQDLLNAAITIDSEGMKRKEVDINGYKGQMNYKKEKILLLWSTEDYTFCISMNGNVSTDEIVKMARSLAKK